MDEDQPGRDDALRQDQGLDGPSPGLPDQTDGTGAQPPRTTMRYSRKRVLVLGGAFAAGLVGVVAGLRALGGSAGSTVSSVGEAVTDQFGPFPVRSVDEVPETSITDWTVKVDGMVDTPLTVDYAVWSTLTRLDETVDFNCVEGWTVDNVRWSGVAPASTAGQGGRASGREVRRRPRGVGRVLQHVAPRDHARPADDAGRRPGRTAAAATSTAARCAWSCRYSWATRT